MGKWLRVILLNIAFLCLQGSPPDVWQQLREWCLKDDNAAAAMQQLLDAQCVQDDLDAREGLEFPD
jgi:hypothetical protein